MLGSIADALEWVDENDDARCVVLASEGKNFCAGADLNADEPRTTSEQAGGGARHIYDECFRMFSCAHPRRRRRSSGAAVGGGLGLACMADFRVGGPGTRMTANFARLGFHHGFGLSVTLPRHRRPARRRWTCCTPASGSGATRPSTIGLLDRFVDDDEEIRADRQRLGGRHRHLGPACRRVDPPDAPRPPGRRGPGRHRPREGRAGPAPPDRRLPRGRAGHGRAPQPELQPGAEGRASRAGAAMRSPLDQLGRGTGTTRPPIDRWVMATSCSSTGRASTGGDGAQAPMRTTLRPEPGQEPVVVAGAATEPVAGCGRRPGPAPARRRWPRRPPRGPSAQGLAVAVAMALGRPADGGAR